MKLYFACPLLATLNLLQLAYGQEGQWQREIAAKVDGRIAWGAYAGGMDSYAPRFTDIDSDGDLDLFISQIERPEIVFYRNDGTLTEPRFTLVTRTYDTDHGIRFRTSGAYLEFADIDADGDLDLFVGESDFIANRIPWAKVFFYRNNGSASTPIWTLADDDFDPAPIADLYPQGGSPRPFAAAPRFVDIDNDGDLDLFVGEDHGNIRFSRNIGTRSQPQFEFVELVYDSILVRGVNVTPEFGDIDRDSDLDLVIGFYSSLVPDSERVVFYRNDGVAGVPAWTLENNFLPTIHVRRVPVPQLADVDGDSDVDFFVGGEDRFLFYENMTRQTEPEFVLKTINYIAIDVNYSASPAFADIDADGDLDMFIGDDDGFLVFYRNEGIRSESDWHFVTNRLVDAKTGTQIDPTLADIDHDGDQDLFIGTFSAGIQFYENIGTAFEFEFRLVPGPYANLTNVFRTVPNFVDIDDDGDFDLLTGGHSQGLSPSRIWFYRNDGDAENPVWVLATDRFGNIDLDIYEAKPTFADIDGDGDFDLVSGSRPGTLEFYENVGDTTAPAWKLVSLSFLNLSVGRDSKPAFADIDGDSDPELFVGDFWGGLAFFRNLLVSTGIKANDPFADLSFQLFQNYPNPFNSATQIEFYLPKRGEAYAAIYNLQGQRVKVLINGRLEAGKHRWLWDGTDEWGGNVGSGVYLFRLKADAFAAQRKLLLVR